MPKSLRLQGERARIVRFFLFVFSCVASLVLLESLATAFAWWKYGTIDVAALIGQESGNKYVADERTGYAATLYPHPYLGFVHNKKIQGPFQRLNNIGLIGRDFPLRRDPSKFTILLTGGSVAAQLSRAGEGGASYLERTLQDRYQFDREVVVLPGADGGWKEPHQAIMCLLYGDVVDAVVSLDGFNEHFALFSSPQRLEYPVNNFHQVNPLATETFENSGVRRVAVTEVAGIRLSTIRRTVYFATRFLRQQIQPTTRKPRTGISVETIFEIPPEWTAEQRFEFNMEQYRKYLRLLNSSAQSLNLKRAFFIQPCPAIGKQLTAEEMRVVGKLDYAETYAKMSSQLTSLRDEGLEIVNLQDVFAQTKETVYEDNIHCRFEEMTADSNTLTFQPSPAYRIMSEAIADHLASIWKIPKKERSADK